MQETEQGLMITNNFLTDMLDAVLQHNYEAIQLVPGIKPLIYHKGAMVNLIHPFDTVVDRAELIDALDALGIISVKSTKGPMILVHVSELFPDTDFLVYITNEPASGLNVTFGQR